MSNAQSIDSLREVNARLLIEISELRRKFAEVEAENVKLKQIIEKMPGMMLESIVLFLAIFGYSCLFVNL